MKRTLLITFSILVLLAYSCGKKDDGKSDDPPADDVGDLAIDPPEISAEINDNFPLLGTDTLPTGDSVTGTLAVSNLLEEPCDSYSSHMEGADCTQGHGGTFQRVFTFDPASLFFASFIVDIIVDMIKVEGNVTFGAGKTLVFPFLKNFDESGALSLEATRTFVSNGDYNITMEEPDGTMYFKLSSVKGGYTKHALAAAFDLQIFGDEAMATDPGNNIRFLFYGDMESGLKVRFARVEYEKDKGNNLTASMFDSDTVPAGYYQGAGHLKLVMSEAGNIQYSAGSFYRSWGFSLAMSGTFDKYLIRKRVTDNYGSAGQFWIGKYDESANTFTDLGIDDSTDAYCQASSAFVFSASDDICFGNSIADEITASFSGIALTAEEMALVDSTNMNNFNSSDEIPEKMSTLAVDW